MFITTKAVITYRINDYTDVAVTGKKNKFADRAFIFKFDDRINNYFVSMLSQINLTDENKIKFFDILILKKFRHTQ